MPTSRTGTLRLHYDGVKVFEKTAPFDASVATTKTEIFLGLTRYDPPSPAVDALYDNVTIEQIP